MRTVLATQHDAKHCQCFGVLEPHRMCGAMANIQNLTNPPALSGGYRLLGRFQHTINTALTTVVAARTTTAGFLASCRWAPATTGAQMYLRYLAARFVTTTAYSTAQETGVDLICARVFSTTTTGGSTLDVGGTLTGSGKRYTGQPTSELASLRIGTNGALTAGVHTLDASPIAVVSGWSAAGGDMVPAITNPKPGILWDSRGKADHLVFATSEGFIIRNLVLMGAAGVGNWYFEMEWDEGVPNGSAST